MIEYKYRLCKTIVTWNQTKKLAISKNEMMRCFSFLNNLDFCKKLLKTNEKAGKLVEYGVYGACDSDNVDMIKYFMSIGYDDFDLIRECASKQNSKYITEFLNTLVID
jgi:hypothetical protein